MINIIFFNVILLIFLLCIRINNSQQVTQNTQNVIYYGNDANEPKIDKTPKTEKIHTYINSHVEKATASLPKTTEEEYQAMEQYKKATEIKIRTHGQRKKEYIEKKKLGERKRGFNKIFPDRKEYRDF